jgi:hypothetical protein
VALSYIIISRFKAQVKILTTHVETTDKEVPWPSSIQKENKIKKYREEISRPTVIFLE